MKIPEKSFSNFDRVLSILVVMVCVGLFAQTVIGQKSRTIGGRQLPSKVVRDTTIPEVGPQPTNVFVTNGNLTCKAYSHQNPADNVVEGRELLLDFGGAYTDTFEFRDYLSAHGPVDLIGTTPTTPPGTINVSTTLNTLVSFSTARQISAVILRDATKSYVFVYDIPGIRYTNDGMNLAADGDIVSIQFCFSPPLTPSAAEAYVAGRVLNAAGRGVAGARITITNAATGEISTALTNPFGYYTVEGLEVGNFYTATVAYKGLKFANPTRVFTLNDSLADVDFVANQ